MVESVRCLPSVMEYTIRFSVYKVCLLLLLLHKANLRLKHVMTLQLYSVNLLSSVCLASVLVTFRSFMAFQESVIHKKSG